MKLFEIAEKIEKLCPLHLAMERDNVGLLVGDRDKDIRKILLCYDVDEFVAKEAVDLGVDLILSHHPLMFYPINRLAEDVPEQRTLRILIKNDIALYSAHTNLDTACGGLNDYLAKILELGNTEVVEVVCEYDGKTHGYGRKATFKTPVSLGNILENCKKSLNLDGCKFVGNKEDMISTVVVNTGGGADIINLCIGTDVDLVITGDIKYNAARSAYENGIKLVDIGHFDTEKIVMDFFAEFFENEENLTLVKSTANKRIINTFC